jgi:hypothetical protein
MRSCAWRWSHAINRSAWEPKHVTEMYERLVEAAVERNQFALRKREPRGDGSLAAVVVSSLAECVKQDMGTRMATRTTIAGVDIPQNTVVALRNIVFPCVDR